eukprot:9169443-Pyramimonas_sp.AAC.1
MGTNGRGDRSRSKTSPTENLRYCAASPRKLTTWSPDPPRNSHFFGALHGAHVTDLRVNRDPWPYPLM